MEPLDLTRDVAEKVLKRAMAPVREIIERGNDEKWDDDESMGIKLGTARELDRDLGVLGVTLATRYREQVEYQTALGVLAQENTRLHTVIEELVALAEKYRAEGDHLAGELSKVGSTKSQGFRAS